MFVWKQSCLELQQTATEVTCNLLLFSPRFGGSLNLEYVLDHFYFHLTIFGFQPMQLLMGPWVFMVFIVIQLFFIVYVAVVVPETKGKTIDEITARFRK